MTDPIRIPIYATGNMMKPPYIEIPPNIARQIVALARDDREEQQFPPEARIYANPHGPPSEGNGAGCKMTVERQSKPVDAGPARHPAQPIPGDMAGFEYSTTPPADDAAVALTKIMCDCVIPGQCEPAMIANMHATSQKVATAILAAIRAGQVPGVEMSCHADAACNLANEQTEQINKLRAQLAEATAKLYYANRERDILTCERNSYKIVFDHYGKHADRAQKTLKGGFGKNYLEVALDELDEARAEVERLKVKLSDSYAIVADIERHTGVCGDGVGRFIRDRIASFKAHQALAAKDAK